MAEKTNPKKPAGQPKRIKGNISFEHDLFSLGPAKMLTNTSYISYKPTLVEKEHTHKFHSVNDKTGTPNKYCSPVGGHFHEIKTEWSADADGNPLLIRAECGPALEIVKRKLRSGDVQSSIEEVAFATEREDQPIIDSHTHDLFYEHTEEISPSSRNRRIEEDRQKIAHLTRGHTPQPQAQAPAATPELIET